MSHLNETVFRIKKWFKKGEKQNPTKVDIFFTEKCNLNCRFCNYSKSSPEEEMSDKKILKVIDDICKMNVKVFGVLGGEPFLRKAILLESMKKIKNHNINGSIVTNGTLIEDKDIKRIAQIKWDLIRFSIDGLPETHDTLRGVKGAFDKSMNNIKKFYEIKKKLNSNSPTVEINFVLTNKNYSDLEPLIKKLSIYGINFVYILPLIELTEESKDFKIREKDVSKVNEVLIRAAEIGKQLNIKSNIKEVVKKNLFLYSNDMEKVILEDSKYLPPCLLPWYTININSNGSVTPCAQWPKSKGIKLNGKSLRQIWFEDFEKFRELIKNNLPEWCSRCCVPLVDENIEIRKIARM